MFGGNSGQNKAGVCADGRGTRVDHQTPASHKAAGRMADRRSGDELDHYRTSSVVLARHGNRLAGKSAAGRRSRGGRGGSGRGLGSGAITLR